MPEVGVQRRFDKFLRFVPRFFLWAVRVARQRRLDIIEGQSIVSWVAERSLPLYIAL